VDIYRLKCLEKTKDRVDIMMSHDWPLGIEQHGDTEGLLRRKPFFREEVQRNDLGSRPNREVLDTIKPKWWFSAHLHVKFKAAVTFQNQQDSPSASESLTNLVPSQINTTKASLKSSSPEASNKIEERSKEEETGTGVQQEAAIDTPTTEFHSLESNNPCGGQDLTDQMTQFLALDKCLPRRQYLSILHVPVDKPKEEARLEYDLEWLAILRKTHKLTSKERRRVEVPSAIVEVSDSDIAWVRDRLKGEAVEPTLTIPDSFSATVPSYSHPMFRQSVKPLPIMGNPQTDKLFEILELDHVLTVPYRPDQSSSIIPAHLQTLEADLNPDENEIDIDEDNDAEEDENEIDIDDVIESGDRSVAGGGASTKEEVRADLLGADDNEIDIDSMSENSQTANLEDIGSEGQHVGECDIPAPLKKPRIDE
jgi:lariat debranching enzyme